MESPCDRNQLFHQTVTGMSYIQAPTIPSMAKATPQPSVFEFFPKGERLHPIRVEENGSEALSCGRKTCRGYGKARLQLTQASFNQYQCPECLSCYEIPLGVNEELAKFVHPKITG